MLVGLCNLEMVIPPRAIVQLDAGPNVQGEGPESSATELAVSLCAPKDDPFRPYLLRFARRDHRGGLIHLVDLEGDGVDALNLLTVGGHSGHRFHDRCIVGILPESSYRSRFGRYEALLPSFRNALEHSSTRVAQERKVGSGTTRAQQRQPELDGVTPLCP